MLDILPELVVKFRPNNQITVTLQNVRQSKHATYQGLAADLVESIDRQTKIKRDRAIQIAKYLPLSHKKLVPPLDINSLFQHDLQPAPHKGLSKSKIIRAVDGFGQNLCFIYLYRILNMYCYRNLAYKLYVYIVNMIVYKSAYQLNRQKNFTTKSGQKVLESGAVVELLCGDKPEFAHCTTLTLPASTREAYKCLAAYSGYAVNRLMQVIRRDYKDVKYWFYVWEFQKRGALHLHICHYHPDASEGQLIGVKLCDMWHKVLCDISEQSGVCMFSSKKGDRCTIRQNHQHHTQPMVKGCGRYFAKYAMKTTDGKEGSYSKKHSQTLSPTSYWGSSSQVKEMIKEFSLELRMYATDGSPERKKEQIEGQLLDLNIVSYKQDEWSTTISKTEHYDHRGNMRDKPRLAKRTMNIVISQGVRQTFYLDSKDYMMLLNAYKSRHTGASIA